MPNIASTTREVELIYTSLSIINLVHQLVITEVKLTTIIQQKPTYSNQKFDEVRKEQLMVALQQKEMAISWSKWSVDDEESKPKWAAWRGRSSCTPLSETTRTTTMAATHTDEEEVTRWWLDGAANKQAHHTKDEAIPMELINDEDVSSCFNNAANKSAQNRAWTEKKVREMMMIDNAVKCVNDDSKNEELKWWYS